MIPVLVPRLPDGGRRDAIWEYLRGSFWSVLPYEIVEGVHLEGLFNRSAAVNRAADAAGDWRIVIVADSDTFVPPAQLAAAIRRCEQTGRMVVAHERWRNLTEDTTAALLAGGTPVLDWDTERVGGQAVSGMIVMPRRLWDAVGGFDEGFSSYGWEDLAFARACSVVARVERVEGSCWHLNHERPATAASDSGARRYARYERADTIEELRAVRWSPS